MELFMCSVKQREGYGEVETLFFNFENVKFIYFVFVFFFKGFPLVNFDIFLLIIIIRLI